MNRQELIASLGFLFDPDVKLGLQLFLLVEEEGQLVLRLADLGSGTLEGEMIQGFKDHLEWRTIDDEETRVCPLSELNAEKKTIHHYDLEDLPEGLDVINSDLTKKGIPLFDFNEDRLQDIKAFLIRIASPDRQVVLYKHHHHLNVLNQANTFYFFGDQYRFQKPTGELLRFSFKVDFLLTESEVFVYDINCLESKFDFDQILIGSATTRVTEIGTLGFVENISELKEYARSRAGAKEVLRLNKKSPVLELPFKDIRTFIEGHAYLSRRLRFNADGSQLVFHTHVSKSYFIQLLNDDFLTSQLSKTDYASRTKDGIIDLDGVTPVE